MIEAIIEQALDTPPLDLLLLSDPSEEVIGEHIHVSSCVVAARDGEILFAEECGMKALEIGTGNPGLAQMMLHQKCGFRIVGVEFDCFRKNHKERIFENGIEGRHMRRMRMELQEWRSLQREA